MSGADITAPSEAPALKIPCAKALSRTGNHSALDLVAPGQFPASLKPSNPRNKLKLVMLLASPCSAHDADQTTIVMTNPTRVPSRSNRRPERDWPTAYAIMNAERIAAYSSFERPTSFEISGHMTAREFRSM